MEFNRKTTLLFLQKQIETKLKEEKNFLKEDLEEQYISYQKELLQSIEENYSKGKVQFYFSIKELFDYFFVRFVIDEFDVRMSGIEETSSSTIYSLEVKWIDMERIALK